MPWYFWLGLVILVIGIFGVPMHSSSSRRTFERQHGLRADPRAKRPSTNGEG